VSKIRCGGAPGDCPRPTGSPKPDAQVRQDLLRRMTGYNVAVCVKKGQVYVASLNREVIGPFVRRGTVQVLEQMRQSERDVLAFLDARGQNENSALNGRRGVHIVGSPQKSLESGTAPRPKSS